MMFFHAVKKPFSEIGIYELSFVQNKILNRKNVLIFLLCIQFFVWTVAYLLFSAKTLREYTDSLFICINLFFYTFMFEFYVINVPKIFDLINGFENVTKNYELNSGIE